MNASVAKDEKKIIQESIQDDQGTKMGNIL